MIKTCTVLALAALAATHHAHPAAAHDIKRKGLQIVHPWAHETGTASLASAPVYMIIRNRGRAADRLISASSPRAGSAELATGTAGKFAIKPGAELKLDASSGYVRLLGLTKPLYIDDNFQLTLVFEKAGRIDVEVHIEDAAIAAPHKH